MDHNVPAHNKKPIGQSPIGIHFSDIVCSIYNTITQIRMKPREDEMMEDEMKCREDEWWNVFEKNVVE